MGFIIINSLNKIIILFAERKMSNPANYSPYNKTYKFLLFQNQAYHERNKINAKPCVRTNLRYFKGQNQSQNGSFYNPEQSSAEILNVRHLITVAISHRIK